MQRTSVRSTTWTRRAAHRSTTWTRRATAVVAGALASLTPGLAAAATVDGGASTQTYVVRAVPGQLAALTAELRTQGTVVRQIRLIDADVVRLTAARAGQLAGDPRVASVTRDRAVTLASARDRSPGLTETLAGVNASLGADALHDRGITGSGVDVALIDSGIADVAGVGQVADGIDLSVGDKSAGSFVDGFGHGTHLAGIIDAVAPDARLVDVRVANASGESDVSQVIAGLDWVVDNAHTGGRNIRVVNLSFGTDSRQDYTIDPLAYAAEQAWHHGIVVVTSAGNKGTRSHGVTDPASDPYVLAVGAADTTGREDRVASFSSRGDGDRDPDLVAPGAHIASLRVPGSAIDEAFGTVARTPDGMFRGSGTSQAAAAVSGAVALLLDAQPALSPDQVKAALVGTADDLGYRTRSQGAGLVDLEAAVAAPPSAAVQDFATADGSGSLEAARGTAHVSAAGTQLRGERDWTGQNWGSQNWASQNWASQNWASQNWASQNWASQNWASQNWASQNWADDAWS